MNSAGPRRSTRIRAKALSHASFDCDKPVLEDLVPVHIPDTKLQSHGLKGRRETHPDQKISPDDEHVKTPQETHQWSWDNSSTLPEQLYSRSTEDALPPTSRNPIRKQPSVRAVPGAAKLSVKQKTAGSNKRSADQDHLATHGRHDTQLDTSSEQLYGHPAEGTMIAWGANRMRKQPKIYPVVHNAGSPSKMAKNNYWMASAADIKIARQRSSIRKLRPGNVETRLRKYMDGPPTWYNSGLERANTEKIFILNRTRGIEEGCHAHHEDCPFETLEIAGSRGSVYTVTISHLTSCTCPAGIFSGKGAEKHCKHVIYTLHHVLKAPDHMKYQTAFLTSELREIFAKAPPLPTDVVKEEPKDGRRKVVDGDCPICFTDLDGDEDIVWCRAACGNNIHKSCFNKWAEAKSPVTCPFCRSEWVLEKGVAQKTMLANVRIPTEVGAGGYRNVYDQLDYANHG